MILSAQSIRRAGIIDPFFERTVHRVSGMTYGLGPAGYDIRIREKMTLRHDSVGPRFVLASSIEHFIMPPNVMGFVKDKSTLARQGLSVFNTVIEPSWRGYLTLELAILHPSTISLEAGQPIAQIVFMRLDETTDIPYNGKYQDQRPEPAPAKFER